MSVFWRSLWQLAQLAVNERRTVAKWISRG